MGRCVACGKEAELRCSVCKQVYFCNQTCQRAAWPAHRAVCTKPPSTDGSSPSKPGESAVAAKPAAAPPASVQVQAKSSAASSSSASPAPQPAKPTETDLVRASLSKLRHTAAQHAASSQHTGHQHQHPHHPQQQPQQQDRHVGASFAALCHPATFARELYPGLDVGDLPAGVPRSMVELLSSDAHASLAQAAGARAVVTGQAVLDSVRSKAAARGERMPPEVAATLWPEVFAEAFARELPAALRHQSAASATAAAEAEGLLASPFHALAAAEQVTPATLAAVCGPLSTFTPSDSGGLVHGAAVQHGPFGDGAAAATAAEAAAATEEAAEWSQLVLDDAARYFVERDSTCSAPHVSVSVSGGVCVTSRFTWLESGGGSRGSSAGADGAGAEEYEGLAGEYPALAEALQRLCALPHELNRKLPGLKLTRAVAGSFLLRQYTITSTRTSSHSGAAQATAAAVTPVAPDADGDGRVVFPHGAGFMLDSDATGTSSGASSNGGYKLTAVYTIGADNSDSDCNSNSGLDLQVELQTMPHSAAAAAAAAPARLSLSARNRLLLYRSRQVRTRLLALAAAPPAAATTTSSDGSDGSVTVYALYYFMHGQGNEGLQ